MTMIPSYDTEMSKINKNWTWRWRIHQIFFAETITSCSIHMTAIVILTQLHCLLTYNVTVHHSAETLSESGNSENIHYAGGFTFLEIKVIYLVTSICFQSADAICCVRRCVVHQVKMNVRRIKYTRQVSKNWVLKTNKRRKT